MSGAIFKDRVKKELGKFLDQANSVMRMRQQELTEMSPKTDDAFEAMVRLLDNRKTKEDILTIIKFYELEVIRARG